MHKFTIVYVKGRVVTQGASVLFEAFPGKSMFEVETRNRVSAYIKAYEHLAKLGLKSFVAKDETGGGNPLGFTDAEIKAIEEAKIPFPTRPSSGIRIEKIVWQK